MQCLAPVAPAAMRDVCSFDCAPESPEAAKVRCVLKLQIQPSSYRLTGMSSETVKAETAILIVLQDLLFVTYH